MRFFFRNNHLALLKSWFLPKMLLKKAKTRRFLSFFFQIKLYAQMILLH